MAKTFGETPKPEIAAVEVHITTTVMLEIAQQLSGIQPLGPITLDPG